VLVLAAICSRASKPPDQVWKEAAEAVADAELRRLCLKYATRGRRRLRKAVLASFAQEGDKQIDALLADRAASAWSSEDG
jgi:hypothetical protein